MSILRRTVILTRSCENKIKNQRLKTQIKNIKTGDILQYQLVGAEEADFEQNKLSVTSPIGKALMGKKIGETATAMVPAGALEFEILDIMK